MMSFPFFFMGGLFIMQWFFKEIDFTVHGLKATKEQSDYFAMIGLILVLIGLILF